MRALGSVNFHSTNSLVSLKSRHGIHLGKSVSTKLLQIISVVTEYIFTLS